MEKTLFIFIVQFILCLSMQAQNNAVPVQQLDSLLAIEKKPILFFIHTDWCRYCLMMEQQVFNDPAIANELREDYYFVKLNAEDESPVNFAGRTFQFISTGTNTGIHELAKELGTIDGKVAYPTLTIVNEAMEIVFQYGSAMRKKQLKKVLQKVKLKEDSVND